MCGNDRCTLHDAEASKLLDALERIVTSPAFGFEFEPLGLEYHVVRAQVAEAMADRKRAVAEYGLIASRYAHADPELQPYVASARFALRRIGSTNR